MPDPRDRPADKQTQADQKHAPLRDEQSDFLSLLKLWREYEKQREQLSRAKLRGWCKENFLSYLRLTEWHDVHGQVMEVVKGELALKLNAQPGEYASIHRALLAGLLSQVAKRREQGEYLGANGTQALHPSGFGPVQGAAGVDRQRRTGGDHQGLRAQCGARRARVDRAGRRAPGQAAALRAALGTPRVARRDLRTRDAVRAHCCLRAAACPTSRSIPKAARELFIRHALVHMEYDSRAPFLAHNLKLLEDTEYLQQKGRRVDLLGDETPALRVLRRASSRRHLDRRGLRALAARGRGEESQDCCG